MDVTYGKSVLAADGLGIAGIVGYEGNDLNRDTTNAKVAGQDISAHAH